MNRNCAKKLNLVLMAKVLFLGLVITLSSPKRGEAQGQSIVQANEDGTYTLRVSPEQQMRDFDLEGNHTLIGSGTIRLKFKGISATGKYSKDIEGRVEVQIAGQNYTLIFNQGEAVLDIPVQSSSQLAVSIPALGTKIHEVNVLPAWLSMIPPLLAIILALWIKEVVASLLLGILAGAFILRGGNLFSFFPALLDTIDRYILGSLLDKGHLSVVLFSTMIGGMVALVSRNGGMAGIVVVLSRFAKDNRSSQLITWLLGIAIFFDDYANTLIVGNTMRPVTDKYKVSREKLAYLVDSTAAPVAAVAFVTTWIGAELGYIKDAIDKLNLSEGAYSIFLNSLQYAFYPFLTLIFIFMLIYMRRDFGPMWQAEKDTRAGAEPKSSNSDGGMQGEAEQYTPLPGVNPRWWNAFIPVAMVILVTIIALIYTGLESSKEMLLALNAKMDTSNTWANLHMLTTSQEIGLIRKLGIVIGNANAYDALLWASFSGLLAALMLSLVQKIMGLHQAVGTMLMGFKTMLTAMLILTLAWSLSAVTEDMRTADFITSIFAGNVSAWFLPGLTFVISALIAFATGSSWGTMAILYPLMLPTAWSVAKSSGMSDQDAMELIYHMTSVVLAGSVMGDHCSPISDTTIMSSLASDCDHIAHVRTQMPYALTVGGISLLCSTVFVAIGLPWYINFAVGLGLLYALIRVFGKRYAD